MLDDLDRTFERLLIDEGKINKNEIDISFEQPTGDWSARLSRPTLNLYCFDLRENLKLRTMEMQHHENGNWGRTSMPPRRMDVAYLVTAWARKIEDEHRLLWRALGTLKRFVVLKPEQGEGLIRYQTRDMPLLIADPSGLQVNMTDLWSVMENQMRLGFTLLVTVELDVETGFDSPLVLESTVRVGMAEEPSRQEMSVLDLELRRKGREGHQSKKEARAGQREDEI